MMVLLTDVHEVAYQILEQIEPVKKTTQPTNDNTAWHLTYHAYRARKAAYLALHERNLKIAEKHLSMAIEHINNWRRLKGE